MMFGNRCVETHSQTQETVPVSSGESEFFGIAKADTMGLGMKGLMEDWGATEDWGVEVGAQVNTDSSAAKSIASRRGAGRARRREARERWIQDRVAKGALTVAQVKGENNVADGFTKHVKRHRMDAYMKVCGVVWKSGRHELCRCLGVA